MNFIDLHIHSTHSDGKLTPKQIVNYAIKENIPTISITDHDILTGSKEAIKYVKENKLDIAVISGIEIGADEEELELYDIHILGLFIDLENKKLNKVTKDYLVGKEKQKLEMLKRLNNLGYHISLEELKQKAKGKNYGRVHLAEILQEKYPTHFRDYQDIFDKLLANPKTAYVRPNRKSVREIIDIIHNAGGIAILAHPGLIKNHKQAIIKFLDLGGDGVELNYAYSNRKSKKEEIEIIENIKNIISEYNKNKNVIFTGGTDFHNFDLYRPIGSHGLTLEEFEKIKEYVK